MIVSMTGFAVHSVPFNSTTEEHCAFEIEIKTLNSRFYEPLCKLPSILSSQEMEINQKMKQAFHRGRVYCTVRVTGFSGALEKLLFSPTRVAQYCETAEIIRQKHNLAGQLTVAECMNLPGVFGTEKESIDDATVAQFMRGVDAAIARVLESRKKEGEELMKDLQIRCTRASNAMEKIQELSLKLLIDMKEELARESAKAQAGDEAARALLSERYSQLDKADIHEEIVRFHSHMKSFLECLANGASDEKGRRLDFVLQELMRETNTVTAKCNNYEIATCAVDIKVELEKAREQVQNLV